VAHINQEVPEDLHRAAKAAAALRGVSLKEFVNEALRAAVALATAEAAAAEPARKGAPR
jgi:predicted HicB family RNase H-like nuclease